ncbi:hypothetical protein [Streptomyces sp. NPDC046925]|uniref:hypothetical protein n=1 Tax=Streptomyces sp. NPDC046925 TaxID=3155375 RepID=UPI0033E57E92
MDPELSDADRALLREAAERRSADTAEPSSLVWVALPPLGKGAALMVPPGLAWLWATEVDRPTWIAAHVELWAPKLMLMGGALLAAFIMITLLVASGDNRNRRFVAGSGDRWVRPRDLTEEAQDLLVRTQRAADAILGSDVHRLSLLDQTRNELMLPAHEWEIATALRDYSRLVRQEPAEPGSRKVTDLLAKRRAALEVSRDGLERRVAALEAYACQVVQADAGYEELQQLQLLSDTSPELLDLLARTVRDDLAVAELDGLTGEAAVVADTFTKALKAAKQSAVAALPLPKSA